MKQAAIWTAVCIVAFFLAFFTGEAVHASREVRFSELPSDTVGCGQVRDAEIHPCVLRVEWI